MQIRTSAAACFVGVLVLTMGLRAAPDGRSRTPLSFRLADSAGVVHTQDEFARSRAAVLFFITPECPISQGYVPEMNRLKSDYTSKGVIFFAVQSDMTTTDAELRAHVAEYRYQFPALIDPRQSLIRHTGATVTPEAIVMSASGTVLYQGRIDNRIVSLGQKRPKATEFDLRDALDAVLAGRPVARPRTTAFGCIISRI